MSCFFDSQCTVLRREKKACICTHIIVLVNCVKLKKNINRLI